MKSFNMRSTIYWGGAEIPQSEMDAEDAYLTITSTTKIADLQIYRKELLAISNCCSLQSSKIALIRT